MTGGCFYMSIENRDILFYNAATKEMLAAALGTRLNRLVYYLYVVPDSERYTKKCILKKSGKVRNVAAPRSGLKFIQRNLASILNTSVPQKSCVHGFVPKKSIISNASVHLKRNFVINLDLKDFFPSINFGRVLGLFKSAPFNFNDEVAVTLAQICCFEGSLPQGAPSSPIISNLICRSLDNDLMRLAKSLKLSYSRYADDITFSTNLKELPKGLGEEVEGKFIPSEALVDIIGRNGFELNFNKLRCRRKCQRQEITGIVSNEKLNVPRNYVRRVRAMIHAWEVYGLEKAAYEHFGKYSRRRFLYPEASFRKRVAGMVGYIGMIKGVDSPVYLKLYEKLKSVDDSIKLKIPEYSGSADMVVYCEGPTDPMHLKAALYHFRSKGMFNSLKVDFHMYRDDMPVGHGELYNYMVRKHLMKKDNVIEVYLFDNDLKQYVQKLDGKPFITVGHPKIYMALLPKPEHRDFFEVCIEHFYKDEDLCRKDANGRRLYFAREFDKDTGAHVTEDVRSVKLHPLKQPGYTIIDNRILDKDDRSVALSKKDFALAVMHRKKSHSDVDFSAFKAIFEMLEMVLAMDF